MQFLIPFFRERDRKRAEKSGVLDDSNQFELTTDDISINQIETLEEDSQEFKEIIAMKSYSEFEEIDQNQMAKRRKRNIEATSSITSNIELIRVKNDEDAEESTDPLEITNTNTDFGVSNTSKNTSTNHIDSFFAAMADTVKTFSPYNQVIAKSKIFSVISNLEMKQIQQEAGELPNEESYSN